MHNVLKVGEPYPGKVSEGTRLDYDESGFTLVYGLPGITAIEKKGFESGRYKIALAERSGILFFLSEFKPGIDLSDTPFHMGLYRDDRSKYLPEQIEDGQGFGLTVMAVDTATGILKAIRYIGLSTKLSRELLKICKRQASENVDRIGFGAKLFGLQRQYRAKDLYRYKIVECKG